MKNYFLIGVITVVIILGGYYIFQNFLASSSVANTQQEQQLEVEIPDEKITNSEIEQQGNIDSKYCNVTDDCGLLICSGCFSKKFLKTAPPDLPCIRYEGCFCECINNKCTEACMINN